MQYGTTIANNTPNVDPIVASFQKDIHDVLLSFGGEVNSKLSAEEKTQGNFQSVYEMLKRQAVDILNPTDPAFYNMNGSEQITYLVGDVKKFLDREPYIQKKAPLSMQYLQERIVGYREQLKDLLKDQKANEARIDSFGGKGAIKSLYSLTGPLSLRSDLIGTVILSSVSVIFMGYGLSKLIPYIQKNR